MSNNSKFICQSMVFDIASMALRLVPRGKKRTFIEGKELYELFLTMYKDVHPNTDYGAFLDVLREVFPVYKNPRKGTEAYKITTYHILDTLSDYGMKNFPVNELIQKERLKIEM